MISVLILTKNEEADLPDCLKSVAWSDDVHVFDSFSTDKSVEIALNWGAKVTQRVFDGYASQRNAALRELKFKYEWVLILDADERVSPQLVIEMQNAVRNSVKDIVGFRIKIIYYLFNQSISHSQLCSSFLRLVKPVYASYHREINEVLEVKGEVGFLKYTIKHHAFSKGLKFWIEKHNHYSTLEAERWIQQYEGKYHFKIIKALFSNNITERRYHQKGLFYKIPFRYVVKWFYIVFIRRAFLDGFAGITYATLQSIYEYFIVLKTQEILNGNIKKK